MAVESNLERGEMTTKEDSTEGSVKESKTMDSDDLEHHLSTKQVVPSEFDDNRPLEIGDPRSFPDGGRQAWLCVAGGAACFFCSFGWIK
jgi:hypothetical protein